MLALGSRWREHAHHPGRCGCAATCVGTSCRCTCRCGPSPCAVQALEDRFLMSSPALTQRPGRHPRRAGIEGNNDYLPFDLLGLAFWVSADAATDLTDADVRGLLNNLAAFDATRAEVCSFVGFLEDMRFSLSVRGKRERRESGPTDSRPGWISQTIASDPDASANAGTQSPGVRTGTGCMRARRRFSIGGRPWLTPHES